MPNVNIPKIEQLPESTLLAVGQQVDVFVHDEDPRFGKVAVPSHQLVDQVIADVFAQEGVKLDSDLTRLCVLIARVTVGRLATSDGFVVKFGSFGEYSEVIDVKLRDPEPVFRNAVVEHRTD